MPVRVRFAPGLDDGQRITDVRTALLNWLFARHNGGTFILRVRDASPTSPAHRTAAALCDGLRWLGLDWDEGPDAQPAQLDGCRQAVQFLVERQAAYPCYCSPGQPSQPQPPGCQGNCRALTSRQRAGYDARGIPHALRLKVPRGGQTVLADLVLGEVAFQHAALLDPILLHPGGSPASPLAEVVGDHRASITHVTQDSEQLPGVPYRLVLYEALGWKPPLYAHLPSIAGPSPVDPTQRARDVALDTYRASGYMPLAVVNHLALLGWTPRGKRRLLSLPELAEQFDPRRVSRKPVAFEVERLNWFNRRCLARLDGCEIARLLVPEWRKAYGWPDRAAGTGLSPGEW
jgi:glutamyl/glutaminyl-tRNA synthetase